MRLVEGEEVEDCSHLMVEVAELQVQESHSDVEALKEPVSTSELEEELLVASDLQHRLLLPGNSRSEGCPHLRWFQELDWVG